MISICKYLFEQDVYDSRRERFKQIMADRRARGVNDQSLDPGSKITALSSTRSITRETTRENGPSRISGPTKIPLKPGEVAPGVTKVPSPYGEHPISGDEWSRKFGGGLKKAAETYQENR